MIKVLLLTTAFIFLFRFLFTSVLPSLISLGNNFIHRWRTRNAPAPDKTKFSFIPKGSIRRVAVVGAGSSGIVAAKELLQSGFEQVVVFEQTDQIGFFFLPHFFWFFFVF